MKHLCQLEILPRELPLRVNLSGEDGERQRFGRGRKVGRGKFECRVAVGDSPIVHLIVWAPRLLLARETLPEELRRE